MLNVSVQADALFEPITLALAKQQCRIDADDASQDALFTSVYIPAARRHVERIMRRAIFNQTWARYLDNFPLAASFDTTIAPADKVAWPIYGGMWNRIVIDLPGGRARRIVSITYADIHGAPITMDPSLYRADLSSEPCRLTPGQSNAAGLVWPWQGAYLPGSVVITYEVGSYVAPISETFIVPQLVAGATACVYNLAQSWATGLASIADGQGVPIAGVTLATNAAGQSSLTLPISQAGATLTATYYVAACPADVILAQLLLIGHFYRNPEATTDLKLDAIKLGVDSLLSAHVVEWSDYRPC